MSTLKIQALTATLQKKQARWQAMETEVSTMSKAKRQKLLGVEVPAGFAFPPDTASSRAPGEIAEFAPAVDWRNRNGNHVTPVKHQGGCGSCVSFCTVAVTESMASIEKGQLLDLSEADQHFCSSHGPNCGGWWHDAAFQQIKNRGVCDEACNPYASSFTNNDIWNGTPSCKSCADRNNRAVKITNITTLNSTTDAKNYLTNTGPLAAILEVYTDFFSYQNGVYHKVSGVLEGLHCVTVIGYNETGQYWICKNSWGAGWGDGGFFCIAYGECKIDAYPKIGVSGIVLPPARKWQGWETLG
ncbi:MAG: hypothetical protein IT258_11555, partial [Saprospiraceae bacterium]|nr:hypothetical protein [Saprospiraceae bacterium]